MLYKVEDVSPWTKSTSLIDGNDFLVWQRGGSPNGATASDLTHWEDNFGITGLAANAANVPEPVTLALLFFGLSLISGSRRR